MTTTNMQDMSALTPAPMGETPFEDLPRAERRRILKEAARIEQYHKSQHVANDRYIPMRAHKTRVAKPFTKDELYHRALKRVDARKAVQIPGVIVDMMGNVLQHHRVKKTNPQRAMLKQRLRDAYWKGIQKYGH